MKLFRRIISGFPGKLSAMNYHITIIGGATEIGQTVGMLLRLQQHVTKLTIYDTDKETPGILLDLSHIPFGSKLRAYGGDNTFDRAVNNVDIVLVTGGCTRQPGTTKKKWFQANSKYIKNFATKISKISPMPFIGIATEPINTLVPMAAEIMRNHGQYNPKKLFGITTVDVLKAQYLYAKENSLDPNECYVPVIGGHSNKTIIPLLSQRSPMCKLSDNQIHEFTNNVRSCDDSIIKAKKGWSPTLSIAYGVLVFTRNILDALSGREAQINAYYENNDFGTSFFSGLINVDQTGAGEMEKYSDLSKYENDMLQKTIEELKKDVLRGKKTLELA